METRICPKCNKASYSARETGYYSCPYCGYKPLNGRCEKRITTMVNSVFSIEGEERAAIMIDYSENGARIVYEGESLSVNTALALKVTELEIQRHAKIAWTKNIGKLKAEAGMRLL